MKKTLINLLGLEIFKFKKDHIYINKFKFGTEKRFDIRNDDQFINTAQKVKNDRTTLLDFDRLYILWQMLKNCVNDKYACAEVGSWRGGSAYFTASICRDLLGRDVEFHIFDTFEGHPGVINSSELDANHKEGLFSDTSFETVKQYLDKFKVLIHKGEVSKNLNLVETTQFFFAHIDTDLFFSTKVCIEFFFPRMITGGVIVIDDYGTSTCPGVKKVVDEYMRKNNNAFGFYPMTGQFIIIKMDEF